MVSDGTTTSINDAVPSWSFVTPAIVATITTPCELRITLDANLAGKYIASASSGAKLYVEGGTAQRVSHNSRFEYPNRGSRKVTISAMVSGDEWTLAFVREDAIIPDRPFLAGPPAVPAFD